MIQKKEKPIKKSDKELWTLIEEKIQNNDYLFLKHAKKRQEKDNYVEGFIDWTYCVEGLDLDNAHKIRIIISFDESNLLIVTVIRLDHLG